MSHKSSSVNSAKPKEDKASSTKASSTSKSTAKNSMQQEADNMDAILTDLLIDYGELSARSLKSGFSSMRSLHSKIKYESASSGTTETTEETTDSDASDDSETDLGTMTLFRFLPVAISPKVDKSFKLRAINFLTHDTNIYLFEIPDSQRLNVPLGHHIRLHVMIDGERVKRSYTPIADKPGQFALLVKTYNTGKVSEELAHMRVGDFVFARGPFGHFQFKPDKYTRVCMYAAGTGLTPHYQILKHSSKEKTVWRSLVILTR